MVYDPREGTEPSNQFAQQSLGMEIVANGCDRHQTPPGESFLHSHSLIFLFLFFVHLCTKSQSIFFAF